MDEDLHCYRAAIDIMRNVDVAETLGRREELWAVSGFPDAGYGMILGRMTPAGVERFDQRK